VTAIKHNCFDGFQLFLSVTIYCTIISCYNPVMVPYCILVQKWSKVLGPHCVVWMLLFFLYYFVIKHFMHSLCMKYMRFLISSAQSMS